jgi:glycosyltransferase involved in cell wall biosynthesis
VTNSGAPVKVAIAHDYLTQRGGAERVVLAMARAFPGATIHTTLYDPAETFPEYADLDVRTSWLNRFAFFRKNHRAALPLLPFAASSMQIDADVVLVSSSGWAHGMGTRGRKLVYCYTPARWLHQSSRDLGDHPGFLESLILLVLGPLLRIWDRRAARGAAAYVAISNLVQDRIHAAYGLDSTVLPAPWPDTVDHASEPIGDVAAWLDGRPYELCVSRLLPYKNVRSVVAAYADEPERRLVVVGRGPEEPALRELAGDNVLFLQNISDGQLAWLYRGCTALIAISYEDFGLTPLEAASFGRPSIVLRWGGFLETQVEGVTAVFVDHPTPEAVRSGLAALTDVAWDPDAIRAHADRYSEEVFVEALREAVAALAAQAPSADGRA